VISADLKISKASLPVAVFGCPQTVETLGDGYEGERAVFGSTWSKLTHRD
jgi:hypothetical protein